MPGSREIVAEQFPLLRDQVVSLFENSIVFRELCDDYGACSEALARQGTGEALHREYAALKLRLETELLGYLNEAEHSLGRK